ncbi:MAG: HNH endonuclease [Chloroflexota bacterium]|nr:HNH endonuclease [Chloroflexota bacterium]
MASISSWLRRQVVERAQGRCEYCQTPLAIVVEMEIDHIMPKSVGGRTTLDNLCLACASCNGFKLNFQMAVDPETGEHVSLFNPRTQLWAEHFVWQAHGTKVNGQTPTGRATVQRLRMNREIMIAARQLWVQAGWHPP